MSNHFTIQRAREYYDLGVIACFHLVREPMSTGWNVCVEGTSGTSWTLHTARGEVRSFASLDSAVKAVEESGMRVSSLKVSA